MRLLSLLVVSVLVFGSCVTNKKYQMMQKNDVNKQNMPSDSVFRKYSIEPFDYKIQTNDILSVRFESLTPKEYDFLSKGADPNAANPFVGGALLLGDLVDENGEMPFPVVGKVKVIGMTVYEIQDYLQKIANQYLESPIVKVRLLNYRITFLGEVNREGSITLNNNRVTMLEAIGLAGGLTDLADKTSIKLIRQKGNDTEVVYLNVLDENFIQSPYYYVYQNDILIVPALRQRPFRKYFGQNISLIISSISLLLIVLNYTR
ncbi:MAG: polysaccharide biosynthesis/export family protein [Cytophagales bacterium]|jgi:polysaccharide export outer membrane protein|nr:polysaccharide biosynthesis/export family protein [Cytophagales bacterium]MCA6388637.1 polysaccharide biosynthesis/export family protein [Cytophagales bacterium]MCA6393273.1 polysaccharide biosynthesis/export family protein [Cytophagales bacterium]MCA6397031.1 polysaccharide biosynthesis/export family protein [Cytophagales bacterium]MCA6397995.1 polysaccharide biosynthesis/export family protein [Cytophagales bacterium]